MTSDDNVTSHVRTDIEHCAAKVRELVASGRDDRRAILQIGYNLGRLSELTGLGRGPFWDAWKDAVADGDRPRLEALARDLLLYGDGRPPESGASPVAPENTPK